MVGRRDSTRRQPTSWVTALDLAEVLVGTGCRSAKRTRWSARLVADLVAAGRTLGDLTDDELVAIDGRFEPGDAARLSAAGSVERRITPGGGSHESVRHQIAELRRRHDRGATESP